MRDAKESLERFDSIRQTHATVLALFKLQIEQNAPAEELKATSDKLTVLTTAMNEAGDESAKTRATLNECGSVRDEVYGKLTRAMEECFAMAKAQREIDEGNVQLQELNEEQARRKRAAAFSQALSEAGRAIARPQSQPTH
jgi:hypothetical protein